MSDRPGKMVPPSMADPKTGEVVVPWFSVFAEHDPEALEAYRAWSSSQSRPRNLDLKTHELIIVGIDAVVAWPSPFIDSHIHGAFNAGATIEDLLETSLVSALFGGGHALNIVLTAMDKTLRERRSAGIVTPRRSDARENSQSKNGPGLDKPNGSEWEGIFKRYEPECYQAYQAWRRVRDRAEGLGPKTAALIALAIEALVGRSAGSIDRRLRKALEENASIAEVTEAIMTAAQFGDHVLEAGFLSLARVVEDSGRPG